MYWKESFVSLVVFVMSNGWVCAQQAHPPLPYGPLPSAAQLNWQQMEMYCIVHFGLDTYTDKEWGYGDEDPALFNPAHFDARQIAGAAKAGGFKGILVVAKHHDGFCLWPTATTEHNISKSPYRNGKGDLVREYQIACRQLGMQLGIYCSPWDRNSALYGSPAYVVLYRQQLYELYTRYGKIYTSWHDGANGGDGYYGGARTRRVIDKTTYYGWDSTWTMTRQLQPSAAIFSDIGWDIRWVGNEEGFAGDTCWETYTPHGRDDDNKPANGDTKYWEATKGQRNGRYWMPAECDVPLRRGWFYHSHDDGSSKSPQTLFDLYFKSVGRGACLDLGLSPNRDGRLTDEDVRALAGLGTLIKRTFAVNLASGSILIPSNVRAGNNVAFGAARLLDADRYSYWATDDSVHEPTLELRLRGKKKFNIIRLRENIQLGQRIEGIAVDAWLDSHWQEIAQAGSIGACRLIRMPGFITSSRLRVRVMKSPVCIALSDIGLFAEPYDSTERTAAAESPVLSKKKWTIYQADSSARSSGPAQAIDGDPATVWQGNGRVGSAGSAGSIAVDLGEKTRLTGFTYLPRQKGTAGIVDKYRFETSLDGNSWQWVAEGEFANIRSNPIGQLVSLVVPVEARYFRFTALHLVDGKYLSVAELGILQK